MENCQKCGAAVEVSDLYEDNGLKVCEDCKVSSTQSPSLPCGEGK